MVCAVVGHILNPCLVTSIMKKKVIVDAKADSEGDITHVKFRGNQNFTSVERALPIAELGEIENAHVVHRKNAKVHIRTNADGIKKNNLDDMAGA